MNDNQPDRSNEFDLLTPEEWDVYSRLSESFNEFIRLPVLTPIDQRDFAFHINALKNIVLSRAVAREMAKRDWPGYVKPE
jgi:hypothetical protein